MGYIYKTTNVANGMIYIGQTKKSIEQSYNYIGSGRYFLKAVKEYGKCSFVKDIIEEIDSSNIEYLDERERYWISYYGSDNKCVGYNVSKGGSGWSSYGIKRSDETKKKQSEKRKGKEPWNKGRKNVYSPDQIQRMLDNKKIKSGYEQKPKFVWICPMGSFNKRKDVAKLYGVSPRTISLWCDSDLKVEFKKIKITNE